MVCVWVFIISRGGNAPSGVVPEERREGDVRRRYWTYFSPVRRRTRAREIGDVRADSRVNGGVREPKSEDDGDFSVRAGDILRL